MRTRECGRQNTKTKEITAAAVCAALIFVMTAYLHVPWGTGYVHAGDGLLYLASSVLPPGYAAAAGACGAGLADLLSGYAVWAPGTVVIKAVTALFFTANQTVILCRRNYIALIPSFFACAGGYYLYESLITGNPAAALAGVPGYIIQFVLSALIYIAAGRGLDRMHFKSRFFGGRSA